MKINLNKTTDFISKSFNKISSDRYVALALPFLSLNPTTSALSSTGMVLYQLYNCPREWAQIAMVASSTALGIFFPKGQVALSTCFFFYTHSEKLISHLKKSEWKESGGISLQMILQLIYASSQIYKTPLLQALSLVSQAATEFYQAMQEASAPDRKPEIAALLILGALRLYKASSYLPPKIFYKEKRIILCVTSPLDYNGALKTGKEVIFQKALKNDQYQIIECMPRNLNQLEATIKKIHKQKFHIEHIAFLCHGAPIAIKPTNFLIKMPTDSNFANIYFLNHTEAKRIPEKWEFESFDRFVKIIKNGLCKNGKVSLLSCSSAESINHPEENFSKALAKRLPGIEVTGTVSDFITIDFESTSKVVLTEKTIDIQGHIYKKYLFPPKKYVQLLRSLLVI